MRRTPPHIRTRLHPGSKIMLAMLLLIPSTACASLLPPSISTPLPSEFLPTAVALTLSASGAIQPETPTIFAPPSASQDPPPSANPTTSVGAPLTASPDALPTTTLYLENPTDGVAPQTLAPTLSASPQPATASLEPSPTLALTFTSQPDPSLATPDSTPAPPILDARIQILRLGELSKVVSPLPVSARLTCGEGKVIRVELHGEDGRLLARYVRTYENIPWKSASIGFNMDFEITSAAELGRLVISAEDTLGRIIEINSMDVILLSQGMSELNPQNGLQQRIIIQEPPEKSLIQNGRLIAAGRARPASNQPLRVMLVGEDGKILGQRLAGVSISIPGDYGTFIAEVPFSVEKVTPALLVVFEEGGKLSEISFLTSMHVLLAP